jgi:Xaa-Pro aminopeptidase
VDVRKIQEALKRRGLDGWLLCDFHNRDQIAYQVIGVDGTKFTSRRWFYFIPVEGEPTAVVSKVEPARLDGALGTKRGYRSWRELHRILGETLEGAGPVAMNYSPLNNIPYVASVDAGTVELIRSLGPEVVTSADLIQEFQSLLSPAAYETHERAGELIQRIKDQAFTRVGELVRTGERVTEHEIQQFILKRFDQEGLDCMGELPIVGVNEHPANPHFEPTPENTLVIKKGDTLLIDLWAKLAQPGAVFYDITWCGFVGTDPPPKYVEIFDVVCRARDACLAFIDQQLAAKGSCRGCDADDACRKVVDDAGYGEFFVHRTGHSIGEEVHWTGANIDNLETRDERELVPGCCFSIEPGIYLEGEMAVRTEIDGFIREDNRVAVVGEIQRELVLIDSESRA